MRPNESPGLREEIPPEVASIGHKEVKVGVFRPRPLGSQDLRVVLRLILLSDECVHNFVEGDGRYLLVFSD